MSALSPDYRLMPAFRKMESNADCNLIERENRILPKEIFVLLTDRGRSCEVPGEDKNVKRLCRRRSRTTSCQGK